MAVNVKKYLLLIPTIIKIISLLKSRESCYMAYLHLELRKGHVNKSNYVTKF